MLLNTDQSWAALELGILRSDLTFGGLGGGGGGGGRMLGSQGTSRVSNSHE